MKNHPWKQRNNVPDLAGFVAARLAEDEAAANAVDDHYSAPCTYNAWLVDIARGLSNLARPGVAAHIARHDPARVLREVEAKRAILALHAAVPVRGIDAASCRQCRLIWPCPTLRQVIAVWSDHPDYRQEWAVRPGPG